MKKQNDSKALGWILKNFKKFIPQTILMCFCTSAISLTSICLAFLSKNVLEIAQGQKQGSFLSYGLLFILIVVLQVAFSGITTLLKTTVSGKFTMSIREHLFTVLNRKKYSSVSKYHSGDILNRLTSDTDIIVSNIVSVLPDICSMLTKIIGGTVALVALEPKIAFLVLLFGIGFPAVGRLLNKRYKYLHKECQKTEGITRSFLQECFENNVVIKTFKSEIPFVERLKLHMTDNYKLKIKRAYLSIFTHLSLYSFFTIGYYAVLVWGATQIAENSITFGTLIAFLQLVSQLRLPLQNISSILPRYYSIIASAERILELENLESEPESKANLSAEFDFDSLEGDNISFAYGDNKVLENFSFKISKGSTTAIIGPSGKGKSTLFKLILGLYETQNGLITINNSIRADASTRQLFAYVPQGNMILSGSIKDNLTMCNTDIPLSEVIKACKAAEIHDYIASLPDGYETVLTERGGGLSEGQVQRLSLARALLANTPVLLLDEATSALDQKTELLVLENIKALKDKTVILVTHRKTSINACDNIINV